MVAKSTDGYTLLFHNLTFCTTTAALEFAGRAPHSIERDFAPVSMGANVPMMLLVNPAVPAKDLKEFVAYAKARGDLFYGSTGPGSTINLVGEVLKRDAGIKLDHIPFRGAAPLVQELLAGRIQFGGDQLSSSLPTSAPARCAPVATLAAQRATACRTCPPRASRASPASSCSAGTASSPRPRPRPPVLARLQREIAAAAQHPRRRAPHRRARRRAGRQFGGRIRRRGERPARPGQAVGGRAEDAGGVSPPLFLYGTLLRPAVLDRMAGQPGLARRLRPARLEGWARVGLRGTPYPTLVAAPGAATEGALLRCGPGALARLAAYEGAAYRLVPVRVITRRGPRNARAWVAPRWRGSAEIQAGLRPGPRQRGFAPLDTPPKAEGPLDTLVSRNGAEYLRRSGILCGLQPAAALGGGAGRGAGMAGAAGHAAAGAAGCASSTSAAASAGSAAGRARPAPPRCSASTCRRRCWRGPGR